MESKLKRNALPMEINPLRTAPYRMRGGFVQGGGMRSANLSWGNRRHPRLPGFQTGITVASVATDLRFGLRGARRPSLAFSAATHAHVPNGIRTCTNKCVHLGNNRGHRVFIGEARNQRLEAMLYQVTLVLLQFLRHVQSVLEYVKCAKIRQNVVATKFVVGSDREEEIGGSFASH